MPGAQPADQASRRKSDAKCTRSRASGVDATEQRSSETIRPSSRKLIISRVRRCGSRCYLEALPAMHTGEARTVAAAIRRARHPIAARCPRVSAHLCHCESPTDSGEESAARRQRLASALRSQAPAGIQAGERWPPVEREGSIGDHGRDEPPPQCRDTEGVNPGESKQRDKREVAQAQGYP